MPNTVARNKFFKYVHTGLRSLDDFQRILIALYNKHVPTCYIVYTSAIVMYMCK